jgi:hypothetical protein
MAASRGPYESTLRDYLFEHPEILFSTPVSRRQKEVHIEGKFIDLLFEVDGIHHIVELKRESITREAVGQVLEYYSRLRRIYPDRRYQVVLAAPNIPKYRSLALEEFGIRCVEISFPPEHATSLSSSPMRQAEVTQVQKALSRPSPLADIEGTVLYQISNTELLPPCNKAALRTSQRLLLDLIPNVQATFLDYEVMPVAMLRTNTPDVLCIATTEKADALTFTHGGAWWAFAFGKAEQFPKNDTPNISANSMPWGLDLGINAELRTSQLALLKSVRDKDSEFDRLIGNHGQLELQTWLKLEHQPRFYHWIPVVFKTVGRWNAETLLHTYDTLESQYGQLRGEWLERIAQNQPNLSAAQAAHMKNKNNKINLAIRLVKTFRQSDNVWKIPYDEQRRTFEQEYFALKPLIQFFN